MARLVRMTDLMLDIETTSTDPVHGNILQISAIKFNLEEMAVGEAFDRQLRFLPGRFWDPSTLEWWSSKPDTYMRVTSKQEDARQVFTEFVEWCYPTGHLRLWGKPSHFEYPFIESYCKQLELVNPFHYRATNDLNTFIRACHFPKNPPKDMDPEFTGTVHNALDDVKHQIKSLFSHYYHTKVTPNE